MDKHMLSRMIAVNFPTLCAILWIPCVFDFQYLKYRFGTVENDWLPWACCSKHPSQQTPFFQQFLHRFVTIHASWVWELSSRQRHVGAKIKSLCQRSSKNNVLEKRKHVDHVLSSIPYLLDQICEFFRAFLLFSKHRIFMKYRLMTRMWTNRKPTRLLRREIRPMKSSLQSQAWAWGLSSNEAPFSSSCFNLKAMWCSAWCLGFCTNPRTRKRIDSRPKTA